MTDAAPKVQDKIDTSSLSEAIIDRRDAYRTARAGRTAARTEWEQAMRTVSTNAKED